MVEEATMLFHNSCFLMFCSPPKGRKQIHKFPHQSYYKVIVFEQFEQKKSETISYKKKVIHAVFL